MFQKIEDYTVVRWGMITRHDGSDGNATARCCAAAVTLVAAAALYEALARSGYFARGAAADTFRPLLRTLFGMIADGTMIEHAAYHAVPRAVRLLPRRGGRHCRSAS